MFNSNEKQTLKQLLTTNKSVGKTHIFAIQNEGLNSCNPDHIYKRYLSQ